MKRLAVAAVLSLALAPLPAHAQTAVDARVQQPATHTVVEGIVTIRAKGSAPAGLKKVELYVNATQVAAKSRERLSNQATEHTLEYRWDTNFFPRSTQLSNNGEYAIKVVAVSNTGDRAGDTAKVFVNNPPAAVAGLTVSTGDGSAQLSWDPNPEPDVFAYIVERDSGEGFVEVARPASAAHEDKVEPGSYTYRVSALRRSPRSADGIAGPPMKSATVKVLPPAYDYGSGDRAGRKGAARAVAKKGRKAFDVGGRRVGRVGLPGGIAVPGLTGLPSVPEPQPEWGTYEQHLPFGKARPASFPETGIGNVAAVSPDRIIPPDGLRWVAAGLWLIVAAGMLTFAGRRLEPEPPRPLVPLHQKT